MPILEKGCCCCTLETCVRVQGWLALVGSLIAIAIVAVGLGTVPHAHDDIDEDQATALKVFFSILMVFFVVGMVAAILLLIGVSKRKRAYFWPFMILTVLGLLGNITSIFWIENDSEKFHLAIVRCVISTALGIYYLINVASLYQKFGEEERNPSSKDMRMRLA